MNLVLAAACFSITLLFIPAAVNCKSVPVMQYRYKIGDTVILTGYISTSTYLSRSDNSDKEYFNTAYNLQLEKSIDISDNRDLLKYYRNISHIEIEDPFKSGIHRFKSNKVTIRGVLKTFSSRPGYYRQYSTPVKMEIIKIDPIE